MSTTNTRPSSSVSNTITLQEPGSSQQTLVLRLNPRKKKVTWKEGTVDNEFMGKKSSKKCCIFHKQKPFDEDNSDEEDHDHHHHHHDHKCKDAGEPSTSNWLIDWFIRIHVSVQEAIGFVYVKLGENCWIWEFDILCLSA